MTDDIYTRRRTDQATVTYVAIGLTLLRLFSMHSPVLSLFSGIVAALDNSLHVFNSPSTVAKEQEKKQKNRKTKNTNRKKMKCFFNFIQKYCVSAIDKIDRIDKLHPNCNSHRLTRMLYLCRVLT